MDKKQEIGKVFDEMQEGYTEKIMRWVPFYQALISKGPEALPSDFNPDDILDLGCGNGNTTSILLKKFPQSNYLLVDASNEMIAESTSRFKDHNNIDFKVNYFQNLELPTNAFDLIVATLAIHHLSPNEKSAFFPKLYSALRKNGVVIIADLFVGKEDDDHPALLKQWEDYAKSSKTTNEEWDFIMDHYDRYDFPINLLTYKRTLDQARFSDVTEIWSQAHWKVISAKK